MSDFKRMNKKTFKEVLKNWRDNIFESNCINDSFRELNVNPIDFYEFIEEDFECAEEFNRLSKKFDVYRETEVEKKAMNAESISPTMLVKIIEAKNKARYWKETEEKDDIITATTDEELDDMLNNLISKVANKDKLIG